LEQQKKKDPFITDRLRDVRRFGSFSMAYSTLQDGLQEFHHPDFEGFIAFKKVWGKAVVLSNPVTALDDYGKSTDLFVQAHPRLVICQATREYADVLNTKGFYVTGFGVDNILDMDSFEVSHKIRPNLHRFFTRIKNMDFKVLEAKGDLNVLHEINQDWLRIKQNKLEFSFLARPFVSNEEQDVRIFILQKDNKTLGFCTFDPIYSRSQDGSINAYVLQHLRVFSGNPRGATHFLLISALRQLQSEKIERVSLGLSLLHERNEALSKPNVFVEFLLNNFYEKSNLYKCKTIAEHKNRFHPQKEHTFLAMSGRGDIISNFCVIKANGLIG
jgi:lysylphosphatidylglycerol synthetase-like protein (DUF2156 family)